MAAPASGVRRRAVTAWRRARMVPPVNASLTTLGRATARLGGDPTWYMRHLPRAGKASVTLPNGRRLTLWSRGDEPLANDLYWRGLGGYEAETLPVFWALAEQSSVVLDVGAHVGVYSLLAAHARPDGRVVAFEPLAIALEHLRRNLELNRVTNVEIVSAAAGDRPGRADFHFVESDIIPTASGLSRPFMEQWGLPLTTIDVPVVTVDQVVGERGLEAVDLVKLDVELAELAVLRGMQATLDRFRPSIVCEILVGHEDLGDLEQLVLDLGYRLYHLTGDGPVHHDRIEAHWPSAGGYEAAWRNWLFTTTGPEHVAGLWRPERFRRAARARRRPPGGSARR